MILKYYVRITKKRNIFMACKENKGRESLTRMFDSN